MRKLVLAALLLVLAPRPARAELGIGLFVGEPVGLDLKIGLSRQTALDIVIGATSAFREGSASYAHVTYLITPFVARGSSVFVPFRLGIGAAVYGAVENDAALAVRAPLELGFRFRNPVEIYLEIAAVMQLVGRGGPDFGVDGGIGIRIYF